MSEIRYPARVGSHGTAVGILRRDRGANTARQEPAGGIVAAILIAVEQLRAIEAQTTGLGADILAFQLELLQDDALILEILEAADGEGAPAAVSRIFNEQIAAFAGSSSERFSSRAADLADVRDRVLAALRGTSGVSREWPDSTILLVEELTPSAFLELDRSKVVGIVDRRGSPSSHVALLARSEGLPMLVGAGTVTNDSIGRDALIDGERAELVIEPGEATVRSSSVSTVRLDDHDEVGPVVTRSGEQIELHLTVNTLDALEAAPADGFAGIGLVRSELLIRDALALSDVDLQAESYRPLFAWAGERPVTIRLIDAGGDKHVAGLSAASGGFLGLRGARLLMRRPEFLHAQLRAILRAAQGRPARIMVPLVTLPEEMAFVRRELTRAIESEGARSANVLLGMMVETPAAALRISAFDAEFYSLGTNDLAQYTMAVARDGDELPGLSGIADALIELICRVVEHAAGQQRPLSVCGDVAASPEELGRLLECGVRSFCVPPRVAASFRQFVRTAP